MGLRAFGAVTALGLIALASGYPQKVLSEQANEQMGELTQQARGQLSDIQHEVASDAVKQYRIVARSGTKLDKCVQAQQVTAAYLQGQEHMAYANWKRIELDDCSKAGLPIL